MRGANTSNDNIMLQLRERTSARRDTFLFEMHRVAAAGTYRDMHKFA